MRFPIIAGALALAFGASPAAAQHEGHRLRRAVGPEQAGPAPVAEAATRRSARHDRRPRPLSAEPRSLGHRMAARRLAAWRPPFHHRRMDADGPCFPVRSLRPAEAAPRRGESPSVRNADGDGAAPVGPGIVQLRASLSPDPLMGRRGYPLLLASGETANGVDPLVDRQHPHDLFMELSASYSLPLSGPVEPVPLWRPSRRARFRPASLHAPALRDGFAGSADQPPLARFDAYQLRSGHRRARRRRRQARGVALQRPRARPASLRHRDRAARLDRSSAVLESGADPVPAGELGASDRTRSSSSRTRMRRAGRPARSIASRSEPSPVVDHPRLGPPLEGA